ncbi:polysaccharide deacetylase family protein [Saccharibacillus sacchari]|uniref:polysaccharide deacetylase family protein n=1 Tax=Saccharibacillus sacchari TaxID=456493 RepID=UPI0004B0092B|nr:polysaccharide deacetylase family protein [Saccharibacillus sacchari]
MWKKTAMFWLAAGLVLGACGSTAEEAGTSSTEQTANANDAQTTDNATENGESQTTQDPNSQAEETDSANSGENTDSKAEKDATAENEETSAEKADDSSEDSAAASEEIAIEYHMNANYDIVPNEGTDVPKKVVLLTFDDGPKEADMINSLIDTLDKHDAKAIFFVNGYRVKANPDLLKLIHDRGGIIGNHSYDHIILKKESDAEIKKQMEDTQAIVEETIGEAPHFFRPPNGAGNDYTRVVAAENNMLHMNWSVGSLDWVNQNDSQAVIDNVFDQLHSGSNILMHELPWTVEALDDLLTQLEAKGYSFVDPRAIDTTKQP